MLDTGRLCGGAGGRDPDCGDLSGRGADVFGGGPADCVRLRLLQALAEKGAVSMNIVVWKSPKALRGILRRLFGVKAGE